MKKYIFIVSSILFFSCERIFIEPDLASKNPRENFDYLWNECNEKYAYFDLKQLDWDAVYQEYSTKIYDDMSEDSLFNVMGAMMNELQDDHSNLQSSFNVSVFDTRYNVSDNFDWNIIRENYLPRNFYVSGPFQHSFINSTNQEIAYVRFSSFSGQIGTDNLDFLLERYQNTKGLILDLRENGGGSISDVEGLLSRFIEQETLVYYSRIKNGTGHNDFSKPEPVYFIPHEGIRYKQKVILLVDRGTYSAGSFTALATKAIPNITLMGSTTGGGLGVPNGGQLPNGWYYRFSITQILTLDLDNSYEQGVPVDIPVLLDKTTLDRDEVIERAIQELLK